MFPTFDELSMQRFN